MCRSTTGLPALFGNTRKPGAHIASEHHCPVVNDNHGHQRDQASWPLNATVPAKRSLPFGYTNADQNQNVSSFSLRGRRWCHRCEARVAALRHQRTSAPGRGHAEPPCTLRPPAGLLIGKTLQGHSRGRATQPALPVLGAQGPAASGGSAERWEQPPFPTRFSQASSLPA